MGSYRVDEAAVGIQPYIDFLAGELYEISCYWREQLAADPFRFATWCEVIGLTFDLQPGMTDIDLVYQYMFRQRRAVYGGVQ